MGDGTQGTNAATTRDLCLLLVPGLMLMVLANATRSSASGWVTAVLFVVAIGLIMVAAVRMARRGGRRSR